MIFQEGQDWGCPRYSRHGAGWLIDWYQENGINTGSSRATPEAVAWIVDNAGAVAKMQADVAAWVARELDKVIPY